MDANTPSTPTTITLTVGATVAVSAAAPTALRQAISAALTVANPLYLEAEANGRSTRDIDPYLFWVCFV